FAMHDGCNCRAWIQIKVNAYTGPLPKSTKILTEVADAPKCIALNSRASDLALAQKPIVFETMHDIPTLFAAHKDMQFYTWLEEGCCLPKGATKATLDGHYPNLQKGDVLVFEEVLGPRTGQSGD